VAPKKPSGYQNRKRKLEQQLQVEEFEFSIFKKKIIIINVYYIVYD